MAQTFRDFICECELYPYSKEHFTLMKESEEISLLTKTMENYNTLAALDLSNLSSTEYTYTTEYAGQIELIEESVKDKFKSILTSIKKKLVWLLEKIAGMIQKKADKIKKTIITDEMIQSLNNLTPAEQQKVIDKYDSFKGNLGFKFSVRKGKAASPQARPSFFKRIPKVAKALIAADQAMGESANNVTGWKELMATLTGIKAAQDNSGNAGIDLEYNTAVPWSFDDFLWYISEAANAFASIGTKDISKDKYAMKVVTPITELANFDICKAGGRPNTVYHWEGTAGSANLTNKNSDYARVVANKAVIEKSYEQLMSYADTIDTSGKYQSELVNSLTKLIANVTQAGAAAMKAEADGARTANGMYLVAKV